MVRQPKKIKEIEQENYGEPLTKKERQEQLYNTVAILEQNLVAPVCSYEELATGGVRIEIHPSHIKEAISTFTEHAIDYDLVTERYAKKAGISPEEIENQKKELKQLFTKQQEKNLDCALQAFTQHKKELIVHAVWDMFALIEALSSIKMSEELEENFGKEFAGISKKEWAENLTYGYNGRIKQILNVELGRPTESYEYKNKQEFIGYLMEAANALIQKNEKISQIALCEKCGIDEKTFKKTCERFSIDYRQQVLDIKRFAEKQTRK